MKIFHIGNEFDTVGGVRCVNYLHHHFYLSLRDLGHTVIYYPAEKIRRPFSEELRGDIIRILKEEKPDVLFLFVGPDFEKDFARKITDGFPVVTIGVFVDDDGGYYDAWQYWKDCFDWNVTFYPPAVRWRAARKENVIGINWACRPGGLYRPLPLKKDKDIDVSFIGGAGPQRREFIEKLEKKIGMKVRCFGKGWSGGVVTSEEMVAIFNRSKINLNISGQPMNPFLRPRSLARLFFSRNQETLKFVFNPFGLPDNIRTFLNFLNPMSRARPYEVLASGSFVLSHLANEFGVPLRDGEEIVIYKDLNDLARKTRFYLSRDEEAARIARRGHERVVREHTFQNRIRFILDTIFSDTTIPKKRKNGQEGRSVVQRCQ